MFQVQKRRPIGRRFCTCGKSFFFNSAFLFGF
ncbi:hypothetical protein EcE24377A_A0001 (plasmid) [Escherichia coli O139:H28 str. E24377A]|uniref:Uncharacterized protein n=1 Tax=Escherichia coli O139:H28 (strain E24377A / ETEC) TaxID=331111 RepID=A7ZVU6_ECO24|nr:hypothetical protein EcE24377A_A0001 [Escherichia coli O139:H28 str. E24377A]